LEVEVNRPANGELPGQGNATSMMRFTVGKAVRASVWTAPQLPAPKYFPPETGGYRAFDYDAEGNLIVAMWSEGATLRDESVNEEYSECLGFRVAPDGTSTRPNATPFLFRHPPSASNTESLGLLRRILWALGRPWADGLGEVTSEDLDAHGTCRLRAAGWWAGTFAPGVCDLLIEPGNAHLVRQASFGGEGEPPRAECRGEGSRRFGDVVLAERGEFRSSSETITVRLVSFSPTFDADLVAEARKVISRAQTRMVQVMDSRTDPDHPKLRLVQAGDLDKEE